MAEKLHQFGFAGRSSEVTVKLFFDKITTDAETGELIIPMEFTEEQEVKLIVS